MKRQFYFHKKDNKWMYCFFGIIIIINFIAVLFNKGIADQISVFLTILLAFPFAFLLSNESNKNNISFHSEEELDNMFFSGVINCKQIENQELTHKPILKRQKHIDRIKILIEQNFTQSGFKGIVLTGDSGSGKSVLISLLKQQLENEGYSVSIKRNLYNIFDVSLTGKQIVFLDQFEKALEYRGFINSILNYSEKNNCVFVFSFPQTYLSRMNNLFQRYEINHILNYTYILSLNDEDIKCYKYTITKFSGKNYSDITNYIEALQNGGETDEALAKIGNETDCRKLCDELVKVINGEAPLIELELLGFILSLDYSENKSYSREYSFMNIYIDDWVNQFYHPETAYSIIYLMSEFESFSIDDIKLLTFEEEGEFVYDRHQRKCGKITRALKDNSLLYTDTKKDNVLVCGAAHQYISDQFRKYCQNREIPENVKYYVDHLRKCIENKSNNASEYSYSTIKSNYKKYYSKHIGIYAMIVVMFIAVLTINIMKFKAPNEVHYQLIATSLVNLPSIYYIYNYYVRFLKISDNFLVKLTHIVGTIVVILSYIFIEAWGILLGIEIIVLSLSIFFTFYRCTYGIAYSTFRKDFLTFIALDLQL